MTMLIACDMLHLVTSSMWCMQLELMHHPKVQTCICQLGALAGETVAHDLWLHAQVKGMQSKVCMEKASLTSQLRGQQMWCIQCYPALQWLQLPLAQAAAPGNCAALYYATAQPTLATQLLAQKCSACC